MVLPKYLLAVVVCVSLFFVASAQPLSAQVDDRLLNIEESPGDLLGTSYGQYSGLSATDPRIIVPRIINVILGLLGTVATVLIVYAGFNWMTAAGNDDKIEGAKKTISAAVLGLIVIMMAYTITRFVVNQAYTATTGDQYPANGRGILN